MGSFDAKEYSLEELMSNKKIAYAIPPYQRPYVWQIEQNQRLWDDVVECNEGKGENHFLGSLVLMSYKNEEYAGVEQADILSGEKAFTIYHVVDGQQRLISLSVLLAALFADLCDNESKAILTDEDVKQDVDDLKSKMRDCFLTDVRDRWSSTGKGRIPRIIPVRSIYEVYKMLLNKEQEGRKYRLQSAYIAQKENIRKYRESNLRLVEDYYSGQEFFDFYDNLFCTITGRMKFVRILCSESEDPFQVFESLNGTGLSLTGADRIKNKLMGMGANGAFRMPMSKIDAEWKKLEDAVGGRSKVETFLRSYLFIIAKERVSKRRLYDIFVQTYLPQFENVKQVMDDLVHMADLHKSILARGRFKDASGKEKDFSPKTKECLRGIAVINPDQSVVPLLATAREYGFASEFEIITRQLLVLLVRHKVCQLSPNKLDDIFGEFCNRIESDSLDDLVDYLRRKQMPDSRFEANFAAMSCDKSDYSRARYYLLSIENYLRNRMGQDKLNAEEEYTLEHIIPQTLEAESWFEKEPEIIEKLNEESGQYSELFSMETIQSIGNMCLLRRAENSDASNKNYECKLKSYQEFKDEEGKTAAGTFELVKQIVNNAMDGEALVADDATFDERAVERRAKVLAGYARQIWK